ncbi:MAG: succinate dehydrogenase, cytochrome b556 subunit [Candidatus Midichloriaceae bacterium]
MKKPHPLSPHLTIYKPQISSVLSIMHRITGFVMFFGFLIILWTTNIYTFKSSTLEDFGNILTYITKNKFFMSVVILFSYCIFYHMCTGIRYLFWDAGKLMEIKMVNLTGWLAITLSIIFTGVFWYIIIL